MSDSGEETKAEELVIIRRHTRGEEGSHHGGVWKIAYADFMTAMMAFFLVMWLINATDKKTLTQVATYFNPLRLTDKTPSARGLHQSETGAAQAKDNATGSPSPQQGKGKAEGKSEAKPEGKTEGARAKYTEEALFRDPYAVLSKLAGQAEVDQRRAEAAARRKGEGSAGGEAYRDPFEPAFRRDTRADKPESDNKSAQSQPAGSRGADSGAAQPDASQPAKEPPSPPQSPKPAGQAAERAAAAQLEAQIKQELARSLTGSLPGIDVTVTEEGVLVSLTDDYDFGMFAIASAEPRPATVVIMEKLARVLGGRPERLVVRGHTDGRPYKSGTYDNWRLSTARAHMAHYMLVRGGIDEKRFERVEGHADRSLRVADDAEAAQNRRIEILLRKAKP